MALVLENTAIDFEQITLGIPNQLQKNVFFSRIFLDDNPIYIQTNECFTSTGIKDTNTKSFCDLVYVNSESIVGFFTDLEKKVKECVLNNKEDWFEDNFTSEDLDDSFVPTIAYHKQGVKLRTYIQKNSITERYNLNCYNYNHELISNEKICVGTNLIPIIEIIGIRFTDKSFNIEIKLAQSLITNVESFNDSCKSMFLGSITNDMKVKNKVLHDANNEDIERENTNNEDIERENTNNEDIERENANKGVSDKSIHIEEVDGGNSEKVIDNKEELREKSIKKTEVVDLQTNVKETVIENVVNSIKSEPVKMDEMESDIKGDINEQDLESLENMKDTIEEIDIYSKITEDNPIRLKTHSDIYKEIWKMYRDDALRVRQQNIKFLLHSKNIQTNYLLNEI